MKTLYPLQVIDIRFQVDHITPIKIQLFEEHRVAPNKAKFFVIIINRRQIKLISGGYNSTQVEVI